MNTRETVRSESFDEQYTILRHSSGLDVLIWEKEGFSSTEARFATKYGSVNTSFRKSPDEPFVSVPEGIAHYLEHKLFENEDTDVFELYAKTGAMANAYTSFDRTVYLFSTTDNWEESLRILLDFVQKPYFTQENVDKERGIIGQEIKMVQDSPERKNFFDLMQALYVRHPVRIDIAGTVESIEEITPELLYKCYGTFYNLHNMVLVLAGNVDIGKVEELCDELLKPSEPIQLESRYPEEPPEAGQQRISSVFPVGVPMFSIGFKSAPCSGMEYEKKSLLGYFAMKQLFGSGAAFLRQLQEEGLVNSHCSFEDFSSSGSYFCLILSGESEDPEEVYRRVLAEIERLKQEGIDREYFEATKKNLYGSTIRSLNNMEDCAGSMLSSYFNGTTVFDSAELLAALTPEDVEQALEELFDPRASAISIINTQS